MTPDMRDAHETARARDARAKAGHPIEWFVYDETQTFTREHLTEALHVYLAPANPRPGDVVQYLGHATTQPRDAAWMLAALNGTGPRDRTHTDQETDMTDHIATANDYRLVAHQELAIAEDILDRHDKPRGSAARHRVAIAHAALAVDSRLAATLELLTEIRDRLPEREVPECGDTYVPLGESCTLPSGHGGPHDSGSGSRWWYDAADAPSDPLDEPAERTDWLDEPTPVPRPEAEDITEEPPVGSQVTECECSHPTPAARCVCPTCDHDNSTDPAPADVDPDEALARALCDMGWTDVPTMTDWIDVARAAREHIEANQLYAYRPVAAERDKAEADLARVTKERDKYMADSAHRLDLLNKAQVKADRYDALRADVEAQLWIARTANFRYTIERFESILARDTERAAKGVQS